MSSSCSSDLHGALRAQQLHQLPPCSAGEDLQSNIAISRIISAMPRTSHCEVFATLAVSPRFRFCASRIAEAKGSGLLSRRKEPRTFVGFPPRLVESLHVVEHGEKFVDVRTQLRAFKVAESDLVAVADAENDRTVYSSALFSKAGRRAVLTALRRINETLWLRGEDSYMLTINNASDPFPSSSSMAYWFRTNTSKLGIHVSQMHFPTTFKVSVRDPSELIPAAPDDDCSFSIRLEAVIGSISPEKRALVARLPLSSDVRWRLGFDTSRITTPSAVEHFALHPDTRGACQLEALDLRGIFSLESMRLKFPCLQPSLLLVQMSDCKELREIVIDSNVAIGEIPSGFLENTKVTSFSVQCLRKCAEIPPQFLANSSFAAPVVFDSGFSNLRAIGKGCFLRCKRITSISLIGLPQLTEILDSFACECPVLEGIQLVDLPNLTSIRGFFCTSCPNLQSAALRNLPKLRLIPASFLSASYSGPSTALQTCRIENVPSLETIGDCFLTGTGIRAVDIPPLLRCSTIPDETLARCARLESVNLSFFAGAVKAGRNVFHATPSLTRLTGQLNALRVTGVSFLTFSGLVDIDIAAIAPKLCVVLPDMLSVCKRLERIRVVDLPHLRSIHQGFGRQCQSLREIVIRNVPALEFVGSNFLQGAASLNEVDVVAGLSSVKVIGSGFLQCSTSASAANLVELHFDSLPWLRHISEDFCADMNGLRSVRLKNLPKLHHIDDRAFVRCASLQHVELAEMPLLRRIGSFFCARCPMLGSCPSVRGLPRLVMVGDGAFANCHRIADVEFESWIETLESQLDVEVVAGGSMQVDAEIDVLALHQKAVQSWCSTRARGDFDEAIPVFKDAFEWRGLANSYGAQPVDFANFTYNPPPPK